MSIENYIIGREGTKLVKNEFKRAVAEKNEFVKSPKSMSKAKRLKSISFDNLKKLDEKIKNEIIKRKGLFQSIGLNSLQSADYSLQSLMIEQNLLELGAVYGNKAYNFCIDTLKVPTIEIEKLEQTALEGFKKVLTCKPSQFSKNTTETFLNNKNLIPNGARVDIIRTNNGPKIIEVNFQWVDGIQALEAFRINGLGNQQKLPSTLLAEIYKDRSKLGIIFLNSASGSREQGEWKSLQIMAENIKSKNIFSSVEIINPESTRSEYMSKFKSLYIDGDPKMITGNDVPDWLEMIYRQAKNQNITVFPNWNPQFDKKSVLIEASERWPEIFAKTYKFSELDNQKTESNLNLVIKGDGFSSKQVAISGTDLFNNIYKDALMFPDEYVLQQKLKSSQIGPMVGFDTSSNKPVYLDNPNCKYNVWIINGKVAGTMASLSNEDIISDKDFNAIPIPC